MLVLTPTASAVIENLVSRADDPTSAGLRIESGAGGANQFAVAVTAAPLPGDQVIQAGGARVFLETGASLALDSKVLDAEVGEHGSVSFALAEQRTA